MKKRNYVFSILCGMVILIFLVTGCKSEKNENLFEQTTEALTTNEEKDYVEIESQLKIFYDNTLYYALCYTTLENDYPDISEATYIGDISKVCKETTPSSDLETNFCEEGCKLYTFDCMDSVTDTKLGFICEYKDKKIYITEVSTKPFMHDNSEEEVCGNIEDESSEESDAFIPYPVGREVCIKYGDWVYSGLLIQCKPEEEEKLVKLGTIGKVCESKALPENDFDATFGTEGDVIYLYETVNARSFYIFHEYVWYEMTGAEVSIR